MARNKQEPFKRKCLIRMCHSDATEDAALVTKLGLSFAMLGQDNICNWDALNSQLLEGKLECSVCYGFMFEHESLKELRGPLAY